ncbi:hypothetical protein [Ulvibacter litoralis]|uniref:Uncharacterized protein n=1 Tax=Ulvibacter litoralis TaxID=227084 RepID=A0A1G7IVQ5_9FLAO|nr:hypothetical protein [Ulvibacter litoralis]GHC63415.1 hypothetical protein GCM10008083_30900 [Ulvibacter litoralis]SDF16733.1 hypothetical protein SAMN05421855_10743 [Ulvibacter litoralis]
MSVDFRLLKVITVALLKTTSEADEVRAAHSLATYYETLLKASVSDASYENTEASALEGGIALSSQQALDCMQDPLRTVRFIKGTYHAILAAISRFPNQKIELLYAGCGPGAPIVIPLLSMFSSEQVSVTLLDITESSIASVSEIILQLKLENYIRDIVLADAILYKFPEGIPLHILVSETMDKGLTKEPQVRIIQNLAPQLVENGLLIPESIDLYTEHSFYSKEPYFDIYKNVLELPPPIKTVGRQLLFSIDKHIQKQKAFEFTSNAIQVPVHFNDTPDICVYAVIIVFKPIQLPKGKTQISNPVCVASLYNLKETSYSLQYTTKAIPSWTFYELVP